MVYQKLALCGKTGHFRATSILSQPNLTVAVTKKCIGTHHPTHLLTANISAISQPIELKFFLVTLQWVLVMTRLKNKLGLS